MVEVIQGNVCERLYLQKQGSHEVFVNNCQLLKQHQINGLRFLYMQFKKVILYYLKSVKIKYY